MSDTKTLNITIDKEFSELIPPLQPEEYQLLEESIKRDGCRDALVVWPTNGNNVLIDGHNRFKICQGHDIEFNTTEIEFDTRDQVADWIDANQLGRRNLKPDQFTLLLGRRYNRQKNKQGAPSGNSNATKQRDQNDLFEKTADKLAKQHGVSAPTVKRAGQFASAVDKLKKVEPEIERKVAENKAPAKAAVIAAARYLETNPDKAKQVLEGNATISDIKREEKRAEHTKKIEQAKMVPNNIQIVGPYDVILADPPWRYDFSETKSREIENQYNTATVDEIRSHKPESAHNSILFLWATAPKLTEAMSVMSSWGFNYKTHAVWDKLKIGMGYWFRGQHELLLVGTKGAPGAPPECERVASIFCEARSKHSQKPECVYEWIERAFPGLKKLEMYCRKPRHGWAAWGNEI